MRYYYIQLLEWLKIFLRKVQYKILTRKLSNIAWWECKMVLLWKPGWQFPKIGIFNGDSCLALQALRSVYCGQYWQFDRLTVWQFLIRLQSYLPCDPIIHRVTTQEKWKLVSNKGLYTYSSLTIAPNWKQPKLPSADEWIIKLWQIHTMKTLQQYKATTVMNLKSIMLPERKQATHCMILLIGHME